MSIRQITRVSGRPLPVQGHDIDTDRIIPARYLKQVTFDGLEKGAFEDDRKALAARGAMHPFDDPRFAGASILVVNRNFGCGSSREHAPQALQRWGIAAIIGESYSDIFAGNSLAMGLPCVTLASEAVGALMADAEAHPEREMTLDLTAMTVTSGDRTFAATMPASAREGLLHGTWDVTGLLLDDVAQIKDVAARLPYVSGF
jgi:3-isopropylmalate/(R)-2-methylmalate dehydratase small subunit